MFIHNYAQYDQHGRKRKAKNQREKFMRSTNRQRSVQSSLRNRRASYHMQSNGDRNSHSTRAETTSLSEAAQKPSRKNTQVTT